VGLPNPQRKNCFSSIPIFLSIYYRTAFEIILPHLDFMDSNSAVGSRKVAVFPVTPVIHLFYRYEFINLERKKPQKAGLFVEHCVNP